MSVETVIEQLQANARTLYRKAIDADSQLDKLSADGLGKHQAIFKPDQGFECQSPRFMPYVEELGRDLVALQQQAASQSVEQLEPAIKQAVKKMELLFATLSQLKGSLSRP